MGRNRGIGKAGRLPWHLPAELQHFKRVTLGKPVLMGRKTYASIGRPLPGRQNLVVTRDEAWRAEGCVVAHSLVEAMELAEGIEVMVIGGGELYRQALPLASRMVLTMVEATPEADTWFPEWSTEAWQLVSSERFEADDKNPLAFSIDEWVRA